MVLATPLVVGTSHKNSSIGYREKLAALLDNDPMPKGLLAKEWALLKTCNRIEFVLGSDDPMATAKQV